MSVLYVDTSALLKRVVVEPESRSVALMLHERAEHGDLLGTSALAWIEVVRALRRSGLPTRSAAEQATSGIARLPLTEDILRAARSVGTDQLRTFDAIHLASALALRATVMVTYDRRLATAAQDAGMTVLAPVE